MSRRLRDLAVEHRGLLVVMLVFVASWLVVNPLTPVATTDDWVYTRSVEILVREGRLRILDLSVATLVSQVFWGALFAAVIEPSLAAVRLSTLVLVLGSAVALYAMCLELDVRPSGAALAAAAYLFNPLSYALAFTFMTDPVFTAFLVISAACYVRGLRPDAPAPGVVLAGSVMAAVAFLDRQQGAFIPVAVGCALLVSGRLRPSRDTVVLLVRVGAVPAAAMLLYYVWLFTIHGVPSVQGSFVADIRGAGVGGAALLVARLTFIEIMYLGAFVLPLVAAAAGRLPVLLAALRGRRWVAATAAAGVLVLVVGLLRFGGGRGRMPYVPQFAAPWGLGPADVRGGRPLLVGDTGQALLTVVTAAAAVLLVLALCRWPDRHPAARAGGVLVASFALWQTVGFWIPSFHFRTWGADGVPAPSLDRYLLPLLPLAIVLVAGALARLRVPLVAGWLVVAVFAFFSVVGTRDALAFQHAVWQLADEVVAAGVPATKVDGGAAWSGYHTWEYARSQGITSAPPGVPWWIDLFAPATDSTYVVATVPVDGYTTIESRPYSSWLHRGPTTLHLLRREDAPPLAAG